MQQNSETKSVHSINFEERQKVSKDAIRLLLEQAMRITENKSIEKMNFKNIQDAKEFFPKWRKEKEFFRKFEISFAISVFFAGFLYFSQPPLVLTVGLFVGFLYFLFFTSKESTPCKYISEMIGDISFLPLKEQAFYASGLATEIFGEKRKCAFNYPLFSFFAVAMFSTLVIFEFWSNDLKIIGFFSILLFLANTINFNKEMKK